MGDNGSILKKTIQQFIYMTKFIFGVYQSFGIVIPRSRSNSIKVWGEETSEKITKSQNFTMVNHTS